MLSLGMSLLISALNTFYEDVKFVMSVALYLLLFLCPVMYFIENIADNPAVLRHPLWFKLYNLNPVADLCVAYRKILLAPTDVAISGSIAKAHPMPLPWMWVAYSAVFSFLVLIFGYSVFNRLKWRFVERT